MFFQFYWNGFLHVNSARVFSEYNMDSVEFCFQTILVQQVCPAYFLPLQIRAYILAQGHTMFFINHNQIFCSCENFRKWLTCFVTKNHFEISDLLETFFFINYDRRFYETVFYNALLVKTKLSTSILLINR